jgi:Kef-type K+ transport system membrane component KefB
MTAIVLAARVVGSLFRLIHQPPVIGEVLAGIMLGPSLLGMIWPAAMSALFPAKVLPALEAVAQFGVVLFMFLVGLELDTSRIRERARAILSITTAGIVCPFLIGTALAVYLYPRYAPRVSFNAFALFIGVSLSVTAFPVLARILTDHRIQRSPMGIVALSCAAAADVMAWCLLAVVVGITRSEVSGAAVTILLAALYVGVMIFAIRPWMSQWARREEGRKDHGLMAAMLVGLLVSSLAAEYIGIHALFGAFLFGAAVPHNTRAAELLTERLHDFVLILLLPAFFALTGLRTQIGLISGKAWLVCLLIILCATAGKFGGSTLAARWTGLSWRDSAALGILMNTRGLVELIVLNIGLDLGVLSPELFAMLVIMAVITTFATSPMLTRLIGPEWRPVTGVQEREH